MDNDSKLLMVEYNHIRRLNSLSTSFILKNKKTES